MKKIIFILVVCLSTQFAFAQNKDLKKGVELIKKGKVEDAIEVLTDVLRKNPAVSEALLMRARAKYEVGSYLGARNDCFSYMESNGIDAPVSGLLGKIEYALEHYKSALSYLDVAMMLNPRETEYQVDRGLTYLELGNKEKACADFYDAVSNGSSDARRLNAIHCRGVASNDRPNNRPNDRPDVDKPKEDRPSTKDDKPDYTSNDTGNTNDESDDTYDDRYDGGNQGSKDDNANNNGSDIGYGDDDGILEDDTSYEDDYPIDNKVEEIYIDEDLKLLVGGGIGSRRIVEIPEMLILSDYSGKITVDICVNEIGEVTSSKINESQSTLKSKGLISLALRKSKEFWFERTNRSEHCGTITFVIRGT